MRPPRSPSTQRRYPLTMICQVYRLARSTVYATASSSAEAVPQKRGPKTAWSDAVLLEAIHGVLATCPFYGEGYRVKGHPNFPSYGHRKFPTLVSSPLVSSA